MKRWVLNIITILSFVVFIALLVLWAISYHFDIWTDKITFSPQFHIGAFDGRISFYNDEVPYRGSIIALSDGKGNTYPSILREIGWNFPGIYYRYFRFPTHTLWTLTLSFFYPVFLVGFLPFTRFFCWVHRILLTDGSQADKIVD